MSLCDYLNKVCEQVHWKPAHTAIRQNLETHILDQADAFIRGGMSQPEGLESAIEQMGDPISIGVEFNHTYRPTPDFKLVLLTCLLFFVGVVLQGTLVSQYAALDMLCLSPVLLLFVGAYYVNYTIFIKMPVVLFLGFIISTRLLVFVPLYTTGLTLLTLLFPLFFAGLLYRFRTLGIRGILLCLLFMVTGAFTIPSTFLIAAINICISSIIMLVAIFSGWFGKLNLRLQLAAFLSPLIAVVGACTFAALRTPHIALRLKSIFDPMADPLGTSYISNLLKDIFSNAQFFGAGVGSVPLTLGSGGDYILATIAQRIGWVGVILAGTLIALLMVYLIRLCIKQTSVLGRLFSVTVTAILGMEIFVSAICVFGLVPSSFPLPFLSFSTSSIILNTLLMGVLFSTTKYQSIATDTRLFVNDGMFKYKDGVLSITIK